MVPIQADASFAPEASAAVSPGKAGNPRENNFLLALLSAAGGESPPAAKTETLPAEAALSQPMRDQEGQKNAATLIAMTLAAPVTALPPMDLGKIPEARVEPASPQAPPAAARETEYIRASDGVEPAFRENWNLLAGGAQQAPRESGEFTAALLDPAPAPPSHDEPLTSDVSQPPDTRLPVLAAFPPGPNTCTAEKPVAPTQAEIEAPAEPTASGGQEQVASAFICNSAEESAGDPKNQASVLLQPRTTPRQGAAAPVPPPAGEGVAAPPVSETPTASLPETRGVAPMADATVAAAGAVKPDSLPLEPPRPDPVKPGAPTAVPRTTAEPMVPRFSVARVLVGAGGAGHGVRLPLASYRASVIAAPGRSAAKTKASSESPEPQAARTSSSQGQCETTPAGGTGKEPGSGVAPEFPEALPLMAPQNARCADAGSGDSRAVSLPASLADNPNVPGPPSPEVKNHSPAPAEPAANPFPASGALNLARMVDRVGQSEMHVGLRTLAFGSVEVHTVVRDSQVGLTVGSEKGDLRAFLAPEVPGLQTSLQQHDLHFDHIRFLDHGPGFDMGFSTGADAQSRSFQHGGRPTPGLPGLCILPAESGEVEIARDPRSGLNVHA
jgi:hypothetical protein